LTEETADYKHSSGLRLLLLPGWEKLRHFPREPHFHSTHILMHSKLKKRTKGPNLDFFEGEMGQKWPWSVLDNNLQNTIVSLKLKQFAFVMENW